MSTILSDCVSGTSILTLNLNAAGGIHHDHLYLLLYRHVRLFPYLLHDSRNHDLVTVIGACDLLLLLLLAVLLT
jgi:hypothetical protein